MTDEIRIYFNEQYGNSDFLVAYGHWPDFKTKREVDNWIKENESLIKIFDALIIKRSCENCGNHHCANNVVAYNYDECIKTKYQKHWKPKVAKFQK